jgi:hypothetical protein
VRAINSRTTAVPSCAAETLRREPPKAPTGVCSGSQITASLKTHSLETRAKVALTTPSGAFYDTNWSVFKSICLYGAAVSLDGEGVVVKLR